MPHHEVKICPRCNQQFECKAGNITECQCAQIHLTNEESVYIENRYGDCLCIKCLQVMQKQHTLAVKVNWDK